jgi:flagellar hook-associated protein 2
MSTIQFGGVVSGLNTQGIIDALVAVKKQPLTDLQSREANLTSQKAAYSQLGNAIDSLITQIKNFTVTSAGAARSASSADTSVFTAAATNSAAVSQYEISVDRLATTTKATSTGALGSAISAGVNTSLTLAGANLATPITAGNMTLTVDGDAVQVAVGDPATTTLQDVIDSLSSALQTQLQAGGDGATVTATIVDGQLQLAVSGNTLPHDISFGAEGDTSNLAAALGLDTQGVTGGQNATITGTAYLDPTLSSLNLPGSITGGQISAIVDGTIVHYTVGDPTKTTLTQFMQGFSAAIQAQLQAGGVNAPADPSATVSMSVVDNKIQLSIGGAGATHSLWFGAAGDTSNALGIVGLANVSASNATNPTLTASTSLGVVRLMSSLDTSGLTGVTSTTTGVLTINGVAINYDSTVDTLSTIISRINNAGAGVIASIDRTTDKLLLTRKDTGAAAIDIVDTSGTLGAALKLAPGTTNAQVIGQTAQVTVDGRTIVSSSNAVTNAIDGVTINLVGKSEVGTTTTLTVGVNTSAVSNSISAFVQSFNSLGDLLDQLTSQTPGTSGGTAGSSGPLASDPTAQTMFLRLRDTLFMSFGSGAYNSLGALGLSTGAVGSAAGTTTRLQIDTTKLNAALNGDASQVASLLDSATGPIGNLLTQLQGYEDPSNKNSYIQAHAAGLASDISSVQRQEQDQQERIDNYQAMLEAQYASMEATLAQLQAQSAQIAATLGYSTSSSSGSGTSSSSSSS